jgi:hypothetical protein
MDVPALAEYFLQEIQPLNADGQGDDEQDWHNCQ